MIRLGALMPEELGFCNEVSTASCFIIIIISQASSFSLSLLKVALQTIGGRKVVVFTNTDESKIATIVLRGSTRNLLDDMERAVGACALCPHPRSMPSLPSYDPLVTTLCWSRTDCGVNTAKSLVKDGRLLPGGGATEIELACRVSRLADSTPGLDQYAIRKVLPCFVAPGQFALPLISPSNILICCSLLRHWRLCREFWLKMLGLMPLPQSRLSTVPTRKEIPTPV